MTPSDSFDLLHYYGAESAGAITLLSDGVEYEEDMAVKLLSNSESSDRINNLPSVSLTSEAPKKMSLAGAQYKLPVTYRKNENKIYEPAQRSILPHLLRVFTQS